MTVVHMKPSSLICGTLPANSSSGNGGMTINRDGTSDVIRSRGDNVWDDE